MKQFFHRLRGQIYMSAGLYRLADGFGSFAAVHVGFLIFTNLQSVFINTLFIRLTGSSDSVMIYNMIVNAFCGPMMLVSASMARRGSPTRSMKIGISFHMAMYVVFFLTMDSLSVSMPLIAMLAGIGNGFYWFSYSYIINVFSTDESRDLAISLIGVLGGVVSLTMPTITGLVITRFTGILGYGVMFGVSLFMAFVTILLARRMRPAPPADRRSHLRALLKLLVTDKLYALTLAGEYCKCLREGVCAFLFNVLLFQAVQNEAIVGVNTFLTGLASITGAWAYGKIVGGKNRIRSMAVASTLLLALAGALFFSLGPVTIILYSLFNAMLGIFLMNPTFSISYALVLGSRKSRPAMPEYIGIRECTVGLGRICGILFTMALPKTTFGYVSAIAALTLLQYGTTLIFRYVSAHTPPPEAVAAE